LSVEVTQLQNLSHSEALSRCCKVVVMVIIAGLLSDY